jgi:hypothetical protein
MSPTTLPPAEPEQRTTRHSELRRLSREPVIWISLIISALAVWFLIIAAGSIVV